MKRIKQVIYFYAFIFSIAVLVQSCCAGSVKITGNGIMAIENNIFEPIDTVDSSFRIRITPETELMASITNFDVMTSATALSCDYPYDNTIVESSLELTLDKTFKVNDEFIIPGTNFIDQTGIMVNTPEYFSEYIEFVINVSNAFLDTATFENGDHTFTVKMNTSDGMELTTSAKVIIDL